MATTYNHAQIGIVDASGNVNVIYPITTGADVSITRTNTKLPTTATTAQKLADSLGKLAFLDSQINDSATSTTSTWSSNLINTKLTELNSNLTKSFQAGVDSIYNKCVSCGSTPTAKTPSACVTAIGTIYTNRYNVGRTQGRTDVTSSPNSYNLYTTTQYTNYGNSCYTNGYNAGRGQGQNDVIANPGAYGIQTTKTLSYKISVTGGKNSVASFTINGQTISVKQPYSEWGGYEETGTITI